MAKIALILLVVYILVIKLDLEHMKLLIIYILNLTMMKKIQ